MAQHKRDCNLFTSNTALADHHSNHGHNFDFEALQLSIINYITIREMYHIKTTANTINYRTDIDNLSDIYSFSFTTNLPHQHNNFNNNIINVTF